MYAKPRQSRRSPRRFYVVCMPRRLRRPRKPSCGQHAALRFALDCAHLTAEKSVNAARAADLAGEQSNDVRNNLGMLVLSPLLLNFTGSEQTELVALAAREKTLNQLITQKCPKPLAA